VNWELMASIASVVVPTFGFFAYVIDQRVQLRIAQNNDALIKQINGTYVKKEIFNERMERQSDKIKALDLSKMERHHCTAFAPSKAE
jgi:hypothetical protein